MAQYACCWSNFKNFYFSSNGAREGQVDVIPKPTINKEYSFISVPFFIDNRTKLQLLLCIHKCS